MVSSDLIATLRDLNRVEKLHLIQVLVSDLMGEERELLQTGAAYPVWSPYDATEAAATMLQALREAEQAPNG